MSTVAGAAGSGPGLGTVGSFGVLGGAGVTNTGPTVITGDLGSCPNPAISGFPPGVVSGTVHANDAVACDAQSDTTIAYNDAAGRAPTQSFGGPTDLGGLTLGDGVYKTPTSFAITGTLTLDGGGNPDSTFIFQAGSTLITATSSAVALVNGAQACNVFWQVGSSATLGVGSQFRGTMLALTSITANTNAGVDGRLLARNGSVTLDSNVITRPTCAAATTTTTTTASTATTAGTATTIAPTATTIAPTATTAGPAGTTSTTAEPTATTIAAPTTSTSVGPTTTTAGPSGGPTTAVPTSSPARRDALPSQNALTLATGTTPAAASASTTIDHAGMRGGELARTGSTPGWFPLAGCVAILLGAAMHHGARRPTRT